MASLSKKWIYVFRVLVAFAAYGFIAIKLYHQGIPEIIEELGEIKLSKYWVYLLAAILLMPFAWGVEAYKWMHALRGVQSISILQALQSVWFGVVAGLLTPNRVGEPLGRMVLIESENRGKATLLAVWCGFSQQAATLIFGFIGLAYWSIRKDASVILSNSASLFFLFFFIATAVVLIVLLGIGKISTILQGVKFLKRFLSGEDVTLQLSLRLTLSILLYSLLRYFIFSTQLVLILHFFGINASLHMVYSGVFLVFLFTSVVPSLAISEVAVRIGFAIIVFESVASNTAGIAAATLALWILNVAFPALAATWFPWFTAANKPKQ